MHGSALGSDAWQSVALDAAGRLKLQPSQPGLIEVRVTATDRDGFVATQTHLVRVRDAADTTAPALAWGGALAGATANNQPVDISAVTTLQAGLAEQQLMGYRLQIAAVGSNAWQTLASEDTAAIALSQAISLASLDPATFANGVYQLRLTAWDLVGRTSEIDARIVIDTAQKTLGTQTTTDATYTLAGHTLALTRTFSLDSLPFKGRAGEGMGQEGMGQADFGNWQLPLLDTQLTNDQPATLDSGATAPWSEGARIWLSIPESISTSNAATLSLSFTLSTTTERLGNDPGAPTVVHPIFTTSQGWQLQAHTTATPTVPENLTRIGSYLYDQTTGLPWVPTSYTLTAPDGSQYSLDAKGNVTGVTFADGQQWIVSDAGIVALGADGNAQRIDFIRDTQGRIARISGVQTGQSEAVSTVYRYDTSGRLTQIRRLASADFGTPIAYDDQGNLFTDPITATLGTASAWLGNSTANQWSGTLDEGGTNATTTLAFTLRESEVAATIHAPGMQGGVILALETDLPADATLDITGATVIGTATFNGKQTRLIRVTEAGTHLIRISGNGAASLRLTIAGDLNRDGKVDGADSQAWQQAAVGSDLIGDINGDGQQTSADRQVLYANTGFKVNLAPVAATTLPQFKTHTDLATDVALAGSATASPVVEDFEGDTVFWRVLGSSHGGARFDAAGQTLQFTPEAGYSGPASITVQADDGYSTSAPITLNVSVSSAPLRGLSIPRLPVMNQGSTATLQVTGNFTDQTGVSLPATYCQILSDTPVVVFVDANGDVHARQAGIAIVTVKAGQYSVQNVITVGVLPTAPDVDRFGNELNVYPRSIDLAEGVGRRQIDVHSLDGSALGEDIGAVASGTRYFISNPAVADITADGLILAKAGGTATVTVINGGRQGTLQLQVRAATVGPTIATVAEGVVTQDVDGNTLTIGADGLTSDTLASISALDLNALATPLPAAEQLHALAAVKVDLSGVTSRVPLQLALNVAAPIDPATGEPAALPAGSEVFFWQEGVIRDANGVEHQTWWLMDNGVIGSDGMARTSSQPYAGLSGGGNILVTSAPSIDVRTGAAKVSGTVVNFDALWSSLAHAAIMPTAVMGMGALAAFDAMSFVEGVSYTIAGSYQLQIPKSALTPNSTVSIPAPPSLPAATPAITGVQYNPSTRQLTISGQNFIPPNQSASLFKLKLWLVPAGDQIGHATPAGTAPENGLIWQAFDVAPAADGTLRITLPDGVALSQHDIYIERSANVSLPPGAAGGQSGSVVPASDSALLDLYNNTRALEAPTYSALVAVAPDAPSQDTLVATATSIDVFQPATVFDPNANPQPVLVKTVTTDNFGNALDLKGSYTKQIAFSDDGSLAYIAGRNNKIYVFDTLTQDVVATVQLTGAAAPISSLVASDGWLYVAEGASYSTGARLSRINIDSGPGYLKQRQVLSIPGAASAYGYRDLVINSHRYLAVTAPAGLIAVSTSPALAAGNVYVIDLYGIDRNGAIDASAVARVDLTAYPGGTLGKGPLYIASGDKPAQFLVSNAKDSNRGTAGITIKTNAENGNLQALSTVVDPALKPENVPNWSDARFQQNIQRAAGSVIVTYNGTTYALVADYNFFFNDPHYIYDNNILGQQIGGKIGIVQDPFGEKGAPVYLGATTPIPDVALDQLMLDQKGMLYASGFVVDYSETYAKNFYRSVFVWNTSQLVQAALDAQQAGRKLTVPIDRNGAGGASSQYSAVTPARYDTTPDGKLFGWIYGMGTYSSKQATPTLTLQNLPNLEALAPGIYAAAKDNAVQAHQPLPKDTSNGTLNTAAILTGAALTELWAGTVGSLQALFGVDNSAMVARMNEAQQVMATVDFDLGSRTAGGDDKLDHVAAAGSQLGAVAGKVVTSLITGATQIVTNFVGYTLRVGAQNAALLNPDVSIGPMPATTPFLKFIDSGTTIDQQINYVTKAFFTTLADGAVAFVKMGADLALGKWESATQNGADALTVLLDEAATRRNPLLRHHELICTFIPSIPRE
ncbi:MAG: hypothetical protein U1A72_13070 [Sulfuritalea sp.]|nr:hypothetical protein [Sulfuritalea sp.]